MKNFTDLAQLTEDQAREHLEKLRWPNGVACPHCGDTEVYTLKGKETSKHPVRKGVYKCKGCRKQFTVTVGTIFEDSHIKINIWLMAISLMCSSKKGISAHQLHRMLNITYKSAWFMAHRIRYAMTQPALTEKLKGIVEVDETYVGGKEKGAIGRGVKKKTPVVALVQRDGIVKSQTVAHVTAENLKSFIRSNVDNTAIVMTDDFKSYHWVQNEYIHGVICHSQKEYVNGRIHTNTIEGYFSILKRGITGVYQHVSPKHLNRYLTEFDYRYNMRGVEDSARTCAVIPGIEGKRLLYRDSSIIT